MLRLGRAADLVLIQINASIHGIHGNSHFSLGLKSFLIGPRCYRFTDPGVQASGCHPSPAIPLSLCHGFCLSLFSPSLLGFSIFSPGPVFGPSSHLFPTVPSASPSPTPSSKFPRLGASSTEGLAAQRASANCALCLSWIWRTTSFCCSSMDGGVGRVYRSHWCHIAVDTVRGGQSLRSP